MAHRLAGPLQNPAGIVQVCAMMERKSDMSTEYADAANTVGNYSRGRTVQQDDFGTHGEDVFMARRHLFQNHLPQAERKRLDGGIVPIEEIEQLTRGLRNTT